MSATPVKGSPAERNSAALRRMRRSGTPMSQDPTVEDEEWLDYIPGLIGSTLSREGKHDLSDQRMLVLQAVVYVRAREHIGRHNIPQPGWGLKKKAQWIKHFSQALSNCVSATWTYLEVDDVSSQEEE